MAEETEQEEQEEESQGLKHEMGGMGEAALPNASRWVQAEKLAEEKTIGSEDGTGVDADSLIFSGLLGPDKFPDYEEPAIVTAVLPSPTFDPSEVTAGSQYLQEPLSFVLGTYRDHEFLEFRLDSRRFEPFDC